MRQDNSDGIPRMIGLEFNRAAIEFDDFVNDCQTKAGAGFALAFNSVKYWKYFFPIFRWNIWAGIADGENNMWLIIDHADIDCAVEFAVFYGVVEQIIEDHFQIGLIGGHPAIGGDFSVNRQMFLAGDLIIIGDTLDRKSVV